MERLPPSSGRLDILTSEKWCDAALERTVDRVSLLEIRGKSTVHNVSGSTEYQCQLGRGSQGSKDLVLRSAAPRVMYSIAEEHTPIPDISGSAVKATSDSQSGGVRNHIATAGNDYKNVHVKIRSRLGLDLNYMLEGTPSRMRSMKSGSFTLVAAVGFQNWRICICKATSVAILDLRMEDQLTKYTGIFKNQILGLPPSFRENEKFIPSKSTSGWRNTKFRSRMKDLLAVLWWFARVSTTA